MANWETLEELLNKPIPSAARDPFFHTQQFPKFMKRKTVLEKDKTANETEHIQHKSLEIRNTKEDFLANARLKTGKFRVGKIDARMNRYDEAQDRQRIFTSISPKDKEFLGEFKYSICPNTGFRSRSVKRKKKKEKLKENREKVKIWDKEIDVKGILKTNVMAIICGKSFKKCLECGFDKCVCDSKEEKLISKVFDNLNRGKMLLDEIKEKKKMKSMRQTSLKKKINRKMKISIDSGLMRYNYANHKNTGFNLPQVNTNYDKSRRYSS